MSLRTEHIETPTIAVRPPPRAIVYRLHVLVFAVCSVLLGLIGVTVCAFYKPQDAEGENIRQVIGRIATFFLSALCLMGCCSLFLPRRLHVKWGFARYPSS
jgi:branched-subunit amino acid permease